MDEIRIIIWRFQLDTFLKKEKLLALFGFFLIHRRCC